jgi:hypothetical protein
MTGALRRLLACFALLALVASGVALAGRGDPKQRLSAADNARAKSMLVKKADLGAGFVAGPVVRPESDFYCRALDESDLTVTGKAFSPSFRAAGGIVSISSYSDVYASRAQARVSWRRGTSAAGQACLRAGARREAERAGLRFVSFRWLSLPRFAEQSVAFRASVRQQGVNAFVDIVALRQSRAFVAITFFSADAPVPTSAVVRLARIIAERMATAMRGA